MSSSTRLDDQRPLTADEKNVYAYFNIAQLRQDETEEGRVHNDLVLGRWLVSLGKREFAVTLNKLRVRSLLRS